MAAANTVQGLKEDATCSICLEYYTDPVTTKCGHNFCRSCISVCSEGTGKSLPCPQCREMCPQGDLSINRQLQSMVEFVKQLSVQQERPPGEGLCKEHEERLKLFCEEDEKLICVICRESSDHEQHKVRPVKEAAQKYKKELQDCLKPLREQMGDLRQCRLREEEVSRTLREKLERERRKIETEFESLRQLLKKQEQTLLGRIKEMGKKIITIENLKIAKLSAKMSSLEDLVREMEKKCEQSSGELLKDIRSTLNRCEHVIADSTPEQIKKRYKELLRLDEDTAHGRLELSEEGRRVTGTDRKQDPLDNPKRFTASACVLGQEGFTSGRHYWELQLLREDGGWTVGVARESVSRKGGVTESPEGGVWAVDRSYMGQYRALTSPRSPLSPRQPPLKLGVYLDYEGGASPCISLTPWRSCTLSATPPSPAGSVPTSGSALGQICALCRGTRMRSADSQSVPPSALTGFSHPLLVSLVHFTFEFPVSDI